MTAIAEKTATIEKPTETQMGGPVHVGIVSDIKTAPSKFGYSWRIMMDHGASYYLNGNSETLAERLFTKGKKAAFICKQKPGRDGRVFQVIEQVFETF